MREWIGLGLVVAMPAVCQAQAPADDFERGLELRRAGKPAEAIPFLERASRRSPTSADLLVNLGEAYADAGQLRKAQAALDRAQKLAPDDVDLKLAQARLAYLQKSYPEAERRLAPLAAIMPNYPEVRELHDRISQAMAASAETGRAPPSWWADVAASYGHLSEGLPSDHAFLASVGRLLGGERYVSGSVLATRQFDRDDTYLEAQAGGRGGYVAVGGAPDAKLQPEWAVRGGLNTPYRTWRGWSHRFSVDAGASRLRTGNVETLNGAYEALKPGRVGITLRWINVWDERNKYRPGFGARLLWAFNPSVQGILGYADAPETQNGFTQRVRAVTAGVGWDATRALSLRLIETHEQHRVYDRDELSVGATRRF